MPPLPPKIECPDCRGRGNILLLIRSVPCTKCGGKGVLPSTVLDIPVGSLDISSRDKTVLRHSRHPPCEKSSASPNAKCVRTRKRAR